jgi:PKD repeat protein
MAKGLSGVEPPGGFVRIAGLADDSMNTDAEYAVQASAGRVDPQWTWYFDSPGSPRTWLATVLALNPDAGQTLPPAPVADFTSSCSALTCTVDASRSTAQITATYSWNWGDGAPVGAGKTAEHTYGAAGSYDVTLTLTDAGGSSTKTQTVAVTAPAPTGSLAVTTNTTGSSQDPDGYSVSVDGGPSQAIARNGTITVANLVAGSHSVLLSGVAPNCTVSGGTSQPVTVQAGQTATTTFAVSCVAVATRLVFTVQPSTTPPLTAISPAVTVKAVDAAGYTVTSFTGPVTMAIGRNGSLLIPGTLSGTTTVNAVGGVATFSNLKIDQSGDGYTLVARASGLTSAESASFNIRLLVCVLGLCV